ncbi:unnamed protein product [Knipowitschia caucasica]
MIRHRIRIPFTQVVFATLLGVAGGFYIYKPSFEPLLTPKEATPTNQLNSEVPKKQDEKD